MRGLLAGITGVILGGCALPFPDGGSASGPRNSSSSSSGGGVTDAGPSAAPLGPEVQAQADRVVPVIARASFSLSDGRVLLDGADNLVVVKPLETTPLMLPVTAGNLRAVVETDVGVLLAGAQGFFVLVDNTLVASPLSSEVDASTVLTMLRGEGDLWIQTTERLVRVANGQAQDVWVGQLLWANARLAWGGDLNGAPALWVVHAGSVTAVQASGSQVGAWVVASSFDAVDLATDALGTVWVRAADGAIHTRGANGNWSWYQLDMHVETLSGSPFAAEVWLAAGGAVQLFAEGRFRAVTNVPAGTLSTPGPDGKVVILEPHQVTVLRARRAITLTGLTDGMTLPGLLSVPVSSEGAAEISSVTLSLDGAADVMVPLPNPQVELDPNALGTGDHQLRVAVAYSSGALSTSTVVHFKVGPLRAPTWTMDILPLFTVRCDRCHGERGSAHRLDSSAAWRDEISTILDAVRSGNMPLNSPSLSAGEVALIERWSTSGFME